MLRVWDSHGVHVCKSLNNSKQLTLPSPFQNSITKVIKTLIKLVSTALVGPALECGFRVWTDVVGWGVRGSAQSREPVILSPARVGHKRSEEVAVSEKRARITLRILLLRVDTGVPCFLNTPSRFGKLYSLSKTVRTAILLPDLMQACSLHESFNRAIQGGHPGRLRYRASLKLEPLTLRPRYLKVSVGSASSIDARSRLPSFSKLGRCPLFGVRVQGFSVLI